MILPVSHVRACDSSGKKDPRQVFFVASDGTTNMSHLLGEPMRQLLVDETIYTCGTRFIGYSWVSLLTGSTPEECGARYSSHDQYRLPPVAREYLVNYRLRLMVLRTADERRGVTPLWDLSDPRWFCVLWISSPLRQDTSPTSAVCHISTAAFTRCHQNHMFQK